MKSLEAPLPFYSCFCDHYSKFYNQTQAAVFSRHDKKQAGDDNIMKNYLDEKNLHKAVDHIV